MDKVTLTMDEQLIVKTKTVLLVEDNGNDAILATRSMKKAEMPCKVVWLKDGEETLTYLFDNCLQQGEQLPHLIMLDIHMPKVNGIEVLQRIRADETLSRIPVVMFTSSNEERDLAESYRSGANSYVCKPINFDQFSTVVSVVCNYWLLVNQGLAND